MTTACLLSRLLSLKSDYNFYALQETLMNNKYTTIKAQVAATSARQESWNECYEDVLDNDGTYIINGAECKFHEIDDSHKTEDGWIQATAYYAEAYANQCYGDLSDIANELAMLTELDTLYQQKQTFYDTNMTETKAFMDSLKGILQQSASDVPGGGGS